MATPAENTSSLLPDEKEAHACVGRGITSPECAKAVMEAMNPTAGESLRSWMFARFSVLRSSAFRMGIMFWFLFTLCFGVAEYALYQTLQGRVLNAIDQSIAERYTRIQAVYNEHGHGGLLRAIEPKGDVPMASSMGYILTSSDGSRLSGNVPVGPAEAGWSVIKGDALGLEGDQSDYRFFTGPVGGQVLSLGKSLDALEDLKRIALSCLLWAALGSMVMAFMAAWIFARRTHRRIVGVSSALDSVAGGNLDARLQVSRAGDDIDLLSSKINSSLDQLKQTVDGMRQVSTDIAHDLKTPLNRLHITIEEAAQKSRTGQCVADELEGALDEAQSINGSFEALLRIAQIEAGARRSQFKQVDLNSVLGTAGEVYQPVVEEHCQQLIVDLPDKPLPIQGDRDLLLQLVVNLIENAMNHCKGDTVIRLSAGMSSEGIVWFQVADTGPGIPAAEREKVFQRLYRLERSRTTKGTGLGLSMVKAIADLHCGTISLDDNAPGLAVTIRFDLDCSASE